MNLMEKFYIFHKDYYKEYTYDPAAATGRMESITEALKDFEVLTPNPASDDDILLIHSEDHLQRIKSSKELVYEIALLSAGGAIYAAQLALESKPIFAAIRPPGHHASPDSCWGFCYFNNIAIAVKKLISENKVSKAAIIDFDLHFGDGTARAFSNDPSVVYHSIRQENRDEFIQDIRNFLNGLDDIDIVAVSAGFDRGKEDWGGLLTANDYQTIGEIINEFTHKNCQDRRFAVLEGGYNHEVLGLNVRSFIMGFY
ncbi:MAG: histone deacetylase family protein [Candidatus Heimdallarchaeaceae archaeon]